MKKKWLLVLAFLGAFFYTYSETIHFSGDSLVAKTSENSEYTSLDGNTEVKTDDLEIQADFIEISGKDFRFITASGRVSGKNLTSNFSFSCERLHYDRITKVALLETAVELHDTENDVRISAQSIEYNQKTDIATMQIEVRLTSKDSICTSALAIYNKAQQRVVLSGSPKIERNKDIFQAQEIILDIQTEEIKLDGKIRGSIVNEDAEDKKQEKDKNKEDSTENRAEQTKDAE